MSHRPTWSDMRRFLASLAHLDALYGSRFHPRNWFSRR
jgi:hypothetical protein